MYRRHGRERRGRRPQLVRHHQPGGADRERPRPPTVQRRRRRQQPRLGDEVQHIAPYNVSNFAVLGNVVFDGGHSLIACSPSQQGTIVGNVCRGLAEFAPDPGGEAGIEIEYKETHVRESVKGTPWARSYDITVAGNQIDDCPVGFLARTVPADDGDAASRREDRPYAFSVTGNSISGSADAGIRIRSGEDAVVATNTVRDGGTDVDVAGDFTSGVQRGLNVRR